MSVELEQVDSPDTDGYLEYRALSSLAVASLLFGVISIVTFLSWWLVVIPVLGLATGVVAYRRIARMPRELTGKPLAVSGAILSVAFAAAGLGRLSYVYATEVPKGYERISYELLQPDIEHPGEAIPASAIALEGKRVFIKGYVYPGQQTTGIKQFLLVRDQGDCCFGGNPKITDRIQVTLVDPLSLTFQTRLHKLAGTFHVAPGAGSDGRGGVFYHLEADHLQ